MLINGSISSITNSVNYSLSSESFPHHQTNRSREALRRAGSYNACALPRAYSHVGNSGLVRLCTSRLGPQTGDLKCPRGPRHTVLTGPVLATVCHWSTREPRVTLSLCPGLVCVAPSGQVHGRLAAGLILRGPLSLLSAANAGLCRRVLAVGRSHLVGRVIFRLPRPHPSEVRRGFVSRSGCPCLILVAILVAILVFARSVRGQGSGLGLGQG